MSEPPQALFRRWVHIEEEDEAGVRVFRPFEDPVALGRGRDSIEFRPDGSVVRYEFSATDAPIVLDGQWRCPQQDEIYTSGSRGGLDLAYKVVSVEPGELRMRPLEA
ncbi:hypothetical protein [Glycomyces tarimensis]